MNSASLLVLGGGSAGFLAAITVKAKHPRLPVTVIRSKEIGIIGVGEGSTPTFAHHLHGYIGVDLKRFYAQTQPTWKMGIHFLWGPRDSFNYTFRHQCDSRYLKLSRETGYYYGDDFSYGDVSDALMRHNKVFLRQANNIPLIELDATYHIENEKFVEFLESFATELGVVIVEDTVETVLQDDSGITGLVLASGRTMTASLYVDCSGFRSVLLGQALQEPYISYKPSLFCDRAVVGTWRRGPDEPIKPYTTAETMNSGWAWQIEHEHHITRGYVYSSDFLNAEDAERELREKNPKIGPTRVVKFISGRYRRAWVKNVLAIGNASGFVEPLESTSLGGICADCQALAEVLRESDYYPTPSMAAAFCRRSAMGWDDIRNFLAIHYKFNRRLDTPFWRACWADADLAGAAPIVDFYQENGPTTIWRDVLIDKIDQFKYEGYLTLLLGQKVPYQTRFQPSAEELELWQKIRNHNRAQGERGMTVEEALAVIRLPEWQWDADFYRKVYLPAA